MKINLTDKNAAAVKAALDAVNGKATTFTITAWSDVAAIAKRAEAQLQNAGIPKDKRSGANVSYSPAGPSARAYKYAAKSTRVRLTRGSSSWYLTDVVPVSAYPCATEHLVLTISLEQVEIVTRHALAQFRVATVQTA